MNISKAQWTTEGDNVRLSMPFAKVDVERRIVSGFATLDNVDKQGDIVTTEASLEAFKKFRGNLREMHQPIAIGKVVSFKEDRYFDPETKKFYKGVYVSAYVSKGAQDAWEKVLDKTYTGFSIGGNITKSDDDFNLDFNKSIRIIKEYELHELSLVDNPANQFATIFSIEKLADGEKIDGYLSKTEISNVYWCSKDDIVHISESSDSNCPSCSKIMQNIGFVEKSDSENVDMIKFLVDSAKGISTSKMTKEEDPMTEETTSVEEDVTKSEGIVEPSDGQTEVEDEVHSSEDDTMATITPETETEKATLTESVVESEDTVGESPKNESEATAAAPATNVNELNGNLTTVKKSNDMINDAVADLKNSLTSAFGDLTTTVKSISEQVADLAKSLSEVTGQVTDVTTEVNKVNGKIAEVATEVATVKGNFNEFGKRVDLVEKDTAFRKSGDLGEIVQEQPIMVEKSLWGGRFLKTSDLFN